MTNPSEAFTFQLASEKERSLLKHLIETILGARFFPSQTGCPYDGLSVKEAVEGVTMWESKCRPHSNDEFPSALIEYKKYWSLMSRLTNRECSKVIYVFFYNDGTARLWNLYEWEPAWKNEQHVSTTMDSNDYVDKEVGYIPNEEGVLISLIPGKELQGSI